MQTIVVVVGEEQGIPRLEKVPRPKSQGTAQESSRERRPDELEPTPFWTWFIENPRRRGAL